MECFAAGGGVRGFPFASGSPVLRSTQDVSPPSSLAAMDQELPWSASLPVGVSADSHLLPAPLTPRRMVEGMVVPGSVVSSPPEDTDMAGGHQRMPDLSLEGPFDVHQDGCCMVCGVASTACDCTIRNLVVRTLVPHMGSSYTTRGCWSMWVRRSRLDYSAVVRNIGCATWDTKRRLRPHSSFNTTRASSCRTYRL